MEPGEFAMRGGLVDLFPPGTTEPLRLDLFGDALEAIRSFDPMSQRSTGERDEVVLLPVSEVLLTAESIERFRTGYRELFGNVARRRHRSTRRSPPASAMSAWSTGCRCSTSSMETLLDYCPGAIVTADHQIAEAFDARCELIADYYDARAQDRRQGRHDAAAPTTSRCRRNGSISSRRNGTRLLDGRTRRRSSRPSTRRPARRTRSTSAAGATRASPRRARRRA